MELQKKKKKKKLFELEDEETYEVDEDSDFPVHEKFTKKPGKIKKG